MRGGKCDGREVCEGRGGKCVRGGKCDGREVCEGRGEGSV